MSREDLVFLAANDDDPFARYEAMQELVIGHLIAALGGGLSDREREAGRVAIGGALEAVIDDPALDDLMRGELMILPSHAYLAEQMLVSDPAAIHAEREGLKAWLGKRLEAKFIAMHERASAVPYSLEAAARGARKLKTQALVYLAAGSPKLGAELAEQQYRAADNMTDRQGALMVLCGLDTPAREAMLADFHQRYADNALVIDKWFTLQAHSLHPDVLAHVKALSGHPDFTLRNPNRVRSLYGAFAANPLGFHSGDGAGYRMIANLILQLDPINPQIAARLVPPLGRWRRTEPRRAAMMREELERIASAPSLSPDTYEQVAKSLG
jgi:aminopeptidase N